MITFLGIVLILFPYLCIFFFENKIRTFLYIFSIQTLSFLFISLITQYLNIFKYPVILSFYIVGLVISSAIFLKKKYKNNIKINFILIFSIAIIFLELFSLHYSYDGVINTIAGAREVSDFSYKYPFFSDEWVGASLVNYTVDSGKLPLINPFFKETFFANPLFLFFSFISNIFLILQINVFENYYLLSILNTIILSLLIYFYLRLRGVSLFGSIIPILFIPLITNSSNLPVTWYFLPFNFSLLFFISFLISDFLKDRVLKIFFVFLSIIFYPPIVIFFIPLIIIEFFKYIKDGLYKKEFKNSIILISFLSVCFLTFIIYLIKNNLLKYILRDNLDNGIVSYNIFYILPLVSIVLVLGGIFYIIKNKDYKILSVLFIGFIFWIIYSFTTKIFVIDHPRIVAITSIFLLLVSGFGLDLVLKFIKNKDYFFYNSLIFIFIIYFSFNFIQYPNNNKWKKLTLEITNNNVKQKITPAPPVNEYLKKEDLILFNNYKRKIFLAPPWKGLVIGSITGNFPLESKGSTITNSYARYGDFIKADCITKNNIASKNNIDLIYSSKFECNNFNFIASTTEGLFLYSYDQN